MAFLRERTRIVTSIFCFILCRNVETSSDRSHVGCALGSDRGHVGSPPSGVDPEDLLVVRGKEEAAVAKYH